MGRMCKTIAVRIVYVCVCVCVCVVTARCWNTRSQESVCGAAARWVHHVPVFFAGRNGWLAQGSPVLHWQSARVIRHYFTLTQRRSRRNIRKYAQLDVLSLFHRFFKQYKIINIWSPPGIEPRTACLTHKHSATELRQPANFFFIVYCLKKNCERERIHLMSKRRLRKKLWSMYSVYGCKVWVDIHM